MIDGEMIKNIITVAIFILVPTGLFMIGLYYAIQDGWRTRNGYFKVVANKTSRNYDSFEYVECCATWFKIASFNTEKEAWDSLKYRQEKRMNHGASKLGLGSWKI